MSHPPLERISSQLTIFKDISTVTVTGFLGSEYIDKVLDGRTSTESSAALNIPGEVDRVYMRIGQDTTSVLQDWKPRFDVVRDKFEDTVVWNPWAEKAAAMADFGPKDGWKHMLCVETGTVNEWQKLEPGDTYEAGQVMRAF